MLFSRLLMIINMNNEFMLINMKEFSKTFLKFLFRRIDNNLVFTKISL